MKPNVTNNRPKLLFAALFMFFMAAAVAASAGAKNFKAEIVSPATGTEINSGKPFSIKVKLTNMDMMQPIMGNMGMPGMGEKIKIEIKIDGQVEASPEFELTSNLDPGANTTLEKTITINFSANKASVPFCTNLTVAGYGDPQGRGNTCGTVAEKVFATNVAQVNDESFFHVYPNPASGNVVFSSSEAINGKLMIYDLTGRVVLSAAFNGKEQAADVSNLSGGTYLYSVAGNDGQILQNGKLAINR